MVETLEPEELDEALGVPGSVVLFAWAPACGACYQVGQIVALAAEEFRRVDFYRLDVREPDSAPAARRLAITVAPTVLLFHDGVERARIEEHCEAAVLWELLASLPQG